MNKKLIGCHLKMNKAGHYLLGTVEDALKYKANTFMIFTGPPQNSVRVDIKNFFVDEFKQKIKEQEIELKSLVVHAPYLINLSNTVKKSTFDFSCTFLEEEIKRVLAIGIRFLVLHPGASVGQPIEEALNSLVKGLDLVLEKFKDDDIIICLETMSGKGSEVCKNIDEIKFVFDNVKCKDKLGVCLDTCHISDSGYDIKNNLEGYLDEFDTKIGLEKIKVVHMNDSKNEVGSHKDRHENIGYGTLGFDFFINMIDNKRLEGISFILETPYIGELCPYEKEIESLRKKEWYDFKKNL